jgi:hypothetical protein
MEPSLFRVAEGLLYGMGRSQKQAKSEAIAAKTAATLIHSLLHNNEKRPVERIHRLFYVVEVGRVELLAGFFNVCNFL